MITVIRRIAPRASSSRGCRRSGAALRGWGCLLCKDFDTQPILLGR
jgi:hypothetical protein